MNIYTTIDGFHGVNHAIEEVIRNLKIAYENADEAHEGKILEMIADMEATAKSYKDFANALKDEACALEEEAE